MTDTNTEHRRRPAQRHPDMIVDGATPRQAEVAQTRRRREGLGAERNLKMHVPGHDSDPNWVYRYANDRPGRIHQLTVYDDWEPAPNHMAAGHEAALGTGTERVVDKYTGEKAILLRKPRKYYEDDKRANEAERKKGDATMRRGPLPDPNGAVAAESYVPGGRNIINGQ